jgi:sulfur-oxidizing protein SoxY
MTRTGLAALFFGISLAAPVGPAAAAEDPWPSLQRDIFKDRPVVEDSLATLEAPTRAEDAALVPLTVKVPGAAPGSIKSLTLVVDQNPSPVVGTFTFGPAMGEAMLSTRVRVNSYSNVRAVVETADGQLHMTTRYVKAAGGCSAPALKDQDEALAEMGKMQFRDFDSAAAQSRPHEVQLMLRHPNNSGLQMDQLTGLYIPAKFVDQLEVKRGDELVFRMEGGISVSENPNFRFSIAAPDGQDVTVRARDTDGKVFTGSFPTKRAGAS